MISLILTAAVLAAAFFLYRKSGKKKKTTVQDIIGGKNVVVSPDGVIQAGNMFRIVVELQPANISNASKQEKNVLWINFFGMLNTLPIPFTFLVHSQFLEMKDYTNWYLEQLQVNSLTEGLRETGLKVHEHLNASVEGISVRDYRCYVMLHYDPVAASVESGVVTGASKLDALLSKGIPKEKMSEEEKLDLSQQVLAEAADYVYGFCDQVGMVYQRLDRAGVYNMIYQTLQRDLSPLARFVDAIRAACFKAIKTSNTREELEIGKKLENMGRSPRETAS